MTKYLEKRVFTLFFAVTFIILLILVLLSWQIIRYGIRRSEDSEIFDITNQVKESLVRHQDNVMQRLADFVDSDRLTKALRRKETDIISDIIKENFPEQKHERVSLFSGDREMILGPDYQPLLNYYFSVMYYSDGMNDVFYFSTGGDIYTVYYYTIIANSEAKKDIDAYLFYLERFDHSLIRTDRAGTYAFAGIEDIRFSQIDNRYRAMVSQEVTRLVQHGSNTGIKEKTIRHGVDTGGGLMIFYGTNYQPELYIFVPYNRSLNQFAHQGLFVFLLILTALAIVITTVTGSWFKERIIAPVKAVNLKMKEVENNPMAIEPLSKTYRGILGDMVRTFNSMSSSLASHTYSLMAYKTITDNLDSAVIWMDGDLNIILCNPVTADIFEHEDCSKIIGRKLQDLVKISPKEIKDLGKKRIFEPNLIVRTEQGDKYLRFVLLSLSTFNSHSGINYIASIYDITKETKESMAREKLELELIKSNRLAELGRLTEGVVHNINSPLNSIMGYAQLMQKTEPDNSDIKKIIKASSNISLLVKKLLYKVREDSISMHRPIDINELINMELDMCRHDIFFSQNVKLVKKLNPIKGKVLASHGEISISIANIIHNAIQSMRYSTEKTFTIETEQQNNSVIISISDTGCGIPPENREKIFRPDFSTKKSSDSTGFGLGLAISKSVIEKYKGAIELTSEAGSGTTFRIILPLQEAKQPGEQT